MDQPAARPQPGGAYRIAGLDERGSELFSRSFEMTETADGGGSSFAFAIPAYTEWADVLSRIVLTGPEGTVALDRGGNVGMVLLRDPATGRVCGILRDWPVANLARGGSIFESIELELDIQVSSGIPDAAAWRR